VQAAPKDLKSEPRDRVRENVVENSQRIRTRTTNTNSICSFGSDPGKTVKLDHFVGALFRKHAFWHPAAERRLDGIGYDVAKLDHASIGDAELLVSIPQCPLS
jgi:hypothetical protein